MLRNDGDTSVDPNTCDPNLTFFYCEDNEKDEIITSGNGVLLFNSVFFAELEQFFGIEGKILEFNFDVTVKDCLNFDFLQDFKAEIAIIKDLDIKKAQNLTTKQTHKIKHQNIIKKEDGKVEIPKKMYKTKFLLIIGLPTILIFLMCIITVFIYKKTK